LLFAIFDLYKGATLMIMPRFDARQALELLAQRQVRHSHWVPTMFTRALAFRDSFPDGFSELEFALHGAAPIGDQLKYEMLSWWGPKLHEYWGSTESGTVTLAKAGEWLAHPGTVGRAIGPFSVQAVDESGQVLPAGEQGRLCIEHKSLSQPFRYHQAQDKTEASYLGPGRFLIGDIGKVDEQGYVYLLDRDSHMIISGGVNIYPAEIEQVLLAHPAVADVAVFGIPNDEWGEEVKAVVELMPGYDHEPALAEDLLLSCRQQLAGYKVPRSIDFSEQLPRYESGKLYMLRLKAPYWQGRD
jgi:long-chain acyl-CoA synthetase